MNLAVIIKQDDELEMARSLLVEITTEYEEMYGVAHTSTLRARVNLAGYLRSMGLHADAHAGYAAVAALYVPAHPWFEEAAEQTTELVGEPPKWRCVNLHRV